MKTIHGTQGTCWLETATCACCASTHSTHCRFFLATLQPSIRSRTPSSFATNATVTSRQSGVCLLITVGTTSPQPFQIRWGMMETITKEENYLFYVCRTIVYVYFHLYGQKIFCLTVYPLYSCMNCSFRFSLWRSWIRNGCKPWFIKEYCVVGPFEGRYLFYILIFQREYGIVSFSVVLEHEFSNFLCSVSCS